MWSSKLSLTRRRRRRFIVCSCALARGGGGPRESRDSVEFFAQQVEIVARSPTIAMAMLVAEWDSERTLVIRAWSNRLDALAFDRVPLVVPGDAVLPDQLEPQLVQVVVAGFLSAGEIGPGTRVGRQAGEGSLDPKALFVGERREAFEPRRRAAAAAAAAGRGVQSVVAWIWSHLPRRLAIFPDGSIELQRGRREDAPRRDSAGIRKAAPRSL